MSDIVVTPTGPSTGDLVCAGQIYKCALGRGDVTADKREGDGATPLGRFPIRLVMFRPDRVAAPDTRLPTRPLRKTDGWCDDPESPRYNQHIERPFAASHEIMWRDDHLYDIVVELGYNDAPAISGRGSAIFMHMARPDYDPTEGCVALAPEDLRRVLSDCAAKAFVVVNPRTA